MSRLFPGHPWENEPLGPYLFHRLIGDAASWNVKFDVDLRPFADFAKSERQKSNHLFMKIAARLSSLYLPQKIIALDRSLHDARYPAGYVRPLRDGADMLEHICVREKPNHFAERDIRAMIQPLPKKIAISNPRFAVWMAKHVMPFLEIKDHYALLVSRNPLKGMGLGAARDFHTTHLRSFTLNVTFGHSSRLTFGAPSCLGWPPHYEPFITGLKTWLENPHTIPRDLVEKPYRTV